MGIRRWFSGTLRPDALETDSVNAGQARITSTHWYTGDYYDSIQDAIDDLGDKSHLIITPEADASQDPITIDSIYDFTLSSSPRAFGAGSNYTGLTYVRFESDDNDVPGVEVTDCRRISIEGIVGRNTDRGDAFEFIDCNGVWMCPFGTISFGGGNDGTIRVTNCETGIISRGIADVVLDSDTSWFTVDELPRSTVTDNGSDNTIGDTA